ncbi:porin [Bacteroides sp. 519]|uniref:porin n=1 Tax=Bacteroides sp. 519 TaxID=2302937 RepID=UPI0013D889B2|nr:porin [Bacteroides sp. 519]NDV58463.1 porin [Bacteroides sp. 519]
MKRSLFSLVFLFSIYTLYSQETVNTWINTLKDRIKLSGYIQAGYTYDDAEKADNTFDIKRIIFMAEGKITDKWSCYFMYNFNSGGTLLEAYTDYHFFPGLSARLGQFKNPMTLEGPMSPSSVELIECYSQATNYYTAMGGSHDLLRGSTGGRDLGLMIYGDLFNKYLTYHVAVLNGQGINTKDKNSNKDIVGSLLVNPLEWLTVGGSFQTGKGVAIGTSEVNPDIKIGDNYSRNRWAFGANIKTKPVSLRAEYLGGKDAKVKSNGYYTTASIHVLPKFDIIASYDYLNKNKDLDMKQTNYVAGVQYWFYPRCRVQAQYTYRDNQLTGSSNLVQAQIQVRF